MVRTRVVSIFLGGLLALAAPGRLWAQPSQPTPQSSDQSGEIVRATVRLTAPNQIRALGVVIAQDGRIVTALTPFASLPPNQAITVRYPNGREVPANIVARDATWGIALLQSRAGHWSAGLALSDLARRDAHIRWTEGEPPRAIGGQLRRRRTFVSQNSELLQDAWEINPHPSPTAIGSGIANRNGEIIAVVVPQSVAPGAANATAPFGVPASAIRALITQAGNTQRPWLGFTGRDVRQNEPVPVGVQGGVRITEVSPTGPAATAGLLAGVDGDIVVGVEGQTIRTTQDLGASLQGRRPSEQLTLFVVRQGQIVRIALVLGNYPPIGP